MLSERHEDDEQGRAAMKQGRRGYEFTNAARTPKVCFRDHLPETGAKHLTLIHRMTSVRRASVDCQTLGCSLASDTQEETDGAGSAAMISTNGNA